MSDISNSSSINDNKWRLNQIDDAVEYLTQEVNSLNYLVNKTEFECSLTVEMKLEKIKALAAFAVSQTLLADLEIMLEESDLITKQYSVLITEVKRSRNFKRLKFQREGKPGYNLFCR